MIGWNSLPTEVAGLIVTQAATSPVALYALRGVNKQWQALAESNDAWRHLSPRPVTYAPAQTLLTPPRVRHSAFASANAGTQPAPAAGAISGRSLFVAFQQRLLARQSYDLRSRILFADDMDGGATDTWHNTQIAKAWRDEDPYYFTLLDAVRFGHYADDFDVVLAVLASSNGDFLFEEADGSEIVRLLGPKLVDDRNILNAVFAAMQRSQWRADGFSAYSPGVNNGLFGALQEKHRAQKSLFLQVVPFDELAFRYASSAIQADAECMRAALPSAPALNSMYFYDLDAHPLNYASAALLNTKSLIVMSVQHYGLALQLTPQKWQDDRDVVLAAVRENGLALAHASARLRQDPGICAAATKVFYGVNEDTFGINLEGFLAGMELNVLQQPEFWCAALLENRRVAQQVPSYMRFSVQLYAALRHLENGEPASPMQQFLAQPPLSRTPATL